MRPKGIIYQRGKSESRGEVRISLPLLTKLGYRVSRGIGAGLMGYFIISLFFIFGPLIEEEIGYRFKNLRGVSTESALFIDRAEAERIIDVQKEADAYGVNSYFSVVIPKIDAAANVVANVAVDSKDEYLEALAQGVAHAKGTYFPGQDQNIFLFAHSTDSPFNVARYNAVFYLLRKLDPGDKIVVFFADRKYVYEVYDKQIVDATDVSWIYEKTEAERLVLATCDPPGTTWRRLVVIAKPVN